MKRLLAMIVAVLALAGAGFFDGLNAQAYVDPGGSGGSSWADTGVPCEPNASLRTWWHHTVYNIWRCAYRQEL